MNLSDFADTIFGKMSSGDNNKIVTKMPIREHGQHYNSNLTLMGVPEHGRVFMTNMAVREHGQPYQSAQPYMVGQPYMSAQPYQSDNPSQVDLSYMAVREHGQPFNPSVYDPYQSSYVSAYGGVYDRPNLPDPFEPSIIGKNFKYNNKIYRVVSEETIDNEPYYKVENNTRTGEILDMTYMKKGDVEKYVRENPVGMSRMGIREHGRPFS